jgi:DNA-binding MarR family transcriptional regulator
VSEAASRSATDEDALLASWSALRRGIAVTEALVAGDLGGDKETPGPWYELVIRLLRTPGHRLPMHRIAADMSITSGGFTKLADRVEEAGLIERQHSAEDRRIVYAALTERGVSVAEDAFATVVASLRANVSAHVSADALASAAGSMRRLRDHHTPSV